jgi:hypothetical protein
MEHLLALLKQLEFVRNVWLETAEPVNGFIKKGPPMDLEIFMERIHQAEVENAAGNSLAVEDLGKNF